MRRFSVILALGSNKGDRKDYINQAYHLISRLDDTCVIKKSSFYETKPMGSKNQEDFINSVILVKTKLRPYKLLQKLKIIEREIGRKKSYRWGPREIDIDIIDYLRSGISINRKDLIIPHIGLKERDFVLIPILEIIDNRRRYIQYYHFNFRS